MAKTLGMLELNSVAKGIETVDNMLKAAQVQLLQARPVCPGKYIVLIAGDVGAVDAALRSGREIGGAFIVDSLRISNLHPQVIQAIQATEDIEKRDTVGVMEYFSLTAAILGADDAAKAADIALIEIRLGIGIGGKSFVTLTGDIGAVKTAVEAGGRNAKEEGMLVASTVLPSINQKVWNFLL